MNADPIAKLAKFTPAGTADAADLLFAAGRASACTHWGWRAAVAALVASNAVFGILLAVRPAAEVPAAPAPSPPVRPNPEPPAPPTPPEPADEPWSFRALRGADPERAPAVEPITGLAPSEPLTVLSGRRGELD